MQGREVLSVGGVDKIQRGCGRQERGEQEGRRQKMMTNGRRLLEDDVGWCQTTVGVCWRTELESSGW